jgi:hypothetical protein
MSSAKESTAKEQAFVISENIQAGTVSKTAAGQLNVRFPKPFIGTPVVVLTPYWALQTSPVGSIETIIAVTAENFTLTSGNAASANYYVNWVAYGPTL